MGKRGGSHIEMILSFIIFMSAIGAAFYFFSPTRTERLVDVNLEYTFREISAETQVKMERYVFDVEGVDTPWSNRKMKLEGLTSTLGDKALAIAHFGSNHLPLTTKLNGGTVIIIPDATGFKWSDLSDSDPSVTSGTLEITIGQMSPPVHNDASEFECLSTPQSEPRMGTCILILKEEGVAYSKKKFVDLETE